MTTPLKVLFISAEAAPFAKTGGLGDVCGSLPKALRALGHEVRIVMPAYQSIETAYQSGKWQLLAEPWTFHVPTGAGLVPSGIFTGQLPGSDVPVYFVAEKNLFDRPNIYGYNDDPTRFAFLSRAALSLLPAMAWHPDVIHAHDWHTGPALTWLATTGKADDRYRRIATLFTIHNLAHQGRSNRDVIDYLGIQTLPLREESPLEVNFMARGIYHATLINTVSPTYAREILTSEGGFGLDGLLRYRHHDVHGILNGLDYEQWNPATDPHLVKNYDVEHVQQRVENKVALQAELGLPKNEDIPLVAMISRLDKQKGFDIVGHVLHLLLNGYGGDAQFVVLGTGAEKYEDLFRYLGGYHQEKMTAVLSYAADLAPRIYAGSDLFLMPSLFEPCGLGQLIAMRYGSVPVVRATGGLADTVRDGISGFTFYDFSPDDFWNAIRRALYIYYSDRDSWLAIQRNGMTSDFSWQNSAYGYQQLYEWAVARIRSTEA
jgi:starch synthase